MPKRGPNRKTRVVAAAGISAVVLVAGGGAVAYATSRGTAPTYVTASVGSYPVVQTLQATGTTEPSSAATVSFATSGIVATVPVAMGDKVTAGQVLATLDTTSLKYALASAQGQVANAELTLTQAESGQVSAASGTGTKTGTNGAAGNGTTRTASATKGSTTATGSTATGSTATGSTATGSTATGSTATGSTATGSTATGSTGTGSRSPGSSHAGSGSTASITAAQKLLLATVRHVDSLLTTTKADLALATTVCSAQTNPPPSPASSQTTAPTTTRASKPPTTTPPTTTPPTTTPSGPAATCPQAQQLVLSDESKLFALQQGLFGQETALDKLLTSAAASTGTTPAGKTSTGTTPAGKTSTGTTPAGKTSTGTTPAGVASGTAGGTGATTVAVSAAQLAADQAAVDAANASLALAQQQLSQAIIVSPLTGVVSSVGLTVGQQAIAGSTTTAVDVIDPTGHGVTLSVDVTKIPQVKVGDKATVVPDGTAIPLEATVSYVAAAPITSSGTAYNVQLEFTSNPTKLRDGIQTAVTITTAQTSKALAVPTSAVNHRGALDYVLIPDGSATKRQIITVGAIGAIYTQVTQGLIGGQRVVLADPNQPIPTNTITGRIARITGGVTGTTGVLGSSAGSSGTRPGG